MQNNTLTNKMENTLGNIKDYSKTSNLVPIKCATENGKGNNTGNLSDFYKFSINSKKAKWSSEAKRFLEEAEAGSLVLNIIISLSCKSQTGEAFEELVNALNEPAILSKIKKINILDTTYLYRHFVPEFSRCNDVSIPTKWYLSNKKAIEKIKAEVELKSWATEIDSDKYRESFKKVMREFEGDGKGTGPVIKFRDTVIAEAATNAYKHKLDRGACVNFILEECAHLLATFDSLGIIVYPMKLYSAGDYMIANHHLNIKHLSYRVEKDELDSDISSSSKRNGVDRKIENLNRKIPGSDLTASDIESAVTNFMKNEVSNLNFFVVGKTGNLIYSNFSLNKLIDKKQNAPQIDENAWVRTYEVIRSGKMFIGEEQGCKGRTYLSMKAPLWVEGEIHGAIGLSIDITDTKRVANEKKRSADLEFLSRVQQIKLKFKEEFSSFISQMAHDIASPLSGLEVFLKSEGISSEQKDTLKEITSKIRNISGRLLEQYKASQNELKFSEKLCVFVTLTLFELVNYQKSQHKKSGTKINLLYDPSLKYSFININQKEFENIVTALIDNAVNNCKKADRSMVNVKFSNRNSSAVIEIVDNGPDTGMSAADKEAEKEQTDLEGNQIASFEDIRNTLKAYEGTLTFSRDTEGNKAITALPFAEQPQWIVTQIDLQKDCTLMIFDNDWNASKQWEKTLETYLDKVKLKVFNSEDEDTVRYIESLSEKEKENVYVLINYDATYSDSEDILNVMMQHNLIKKSVVVTSAYKDSRLQEIIATSGARMLPKQFLKGIDIVLK